MAPRVKRRGTTRGERAGYALDARWRRPRKMGEKGGESREWVGAVRRAKMRRRRQMPTFMAMVSAEKLRSSRLYPA